MKNKIRFYWLWILKISVSGLFAIIILSIFVILYHYNGVGVIDETGATYIKRSPNQFVSNMKEGIVWKYADQYGFYNLSNMSPNSPDILLMGSSHMEAIQISTKDSTGALLNEFFSTYNIGVSGHFICKCVSNMEDAIYYYTPQKYIILETSNIVLNINEMLAATNKKKVQKIDEWKRFVAKYLPAIIEIYYNLSSWKDVDTKVLVANEEEDNKETYGKVLDEFIGIASKISQNADCQLIIFYHPQDMIDRNGYYYTDTNQEALKLFRETCENNNVIFVDMTEPFQKLYEEKHELAHGFINTGVGRGHLNKEGHRVIAETLLDVIKQEEVARCH